MPQNGYVYKTIMLNEGSQPHPHPFKKKKKIKGAYAMVSLGTAGNRREV